MIEVSTVVKVLEEACIGCKACDNVCPTGAIVTTNKLARVDESICTSCMRCLAVCVPHNALVVEPREAPLTLAIAPEEYEAPGVRERIASLCEAAALAPETEICFCLGSTAEEAAAAIAIRGATTLEEIAIATGTRGVCSIFCSAPLDRLLEASGCKRKEPRESKDWSSYPRYASSVGIWNVPEEVAEKWPRYRIKEDQEHLKSNKLENPIFADIAPFEGKEIKRSG